MCRKFAKFATILYFGNLIQELNVLAQFSPYLRDPLPLNSPKTEQEPDAEPGAASRTLRSRMQNTTDLEVNLLAIKEETDGLFWTYTVVQGAPCVCDALAKSRNEFSQAPQSHKVVLQRLPLKQEPTHNNTVV